MKGWFSRDPRRPLSSGDRRLLLVMFERGEIPLREWSRLGDDMSRRRLDKRGYVNFYRSGSVFYVALTDKGGRALEADPIARKKMDEMT